MSRRRLLPLRERGQGDGEREGKGKGRSENWWIVLGLRGGRREGGPGAGKKGNMPHE